MAASIPAELSQRLDEVFGRLSNEQVAERLAEVGHSTSGDRVRRYRGGHAERLSADFVAAVAEAFGVDLRWLMTGAGDRDGGGDFGGLGWVAQVKNYNPGSSELWQRIDEINSQHDLSETAKIIKIEALSAALRAEAAGVEARAAEARARAMERDGLSAEARARAVEEEAKSATARTVALQGKRTEPAAGPPVLQPYTLEEEDRILAEITELEAQLSRSRGSQRGTG